MDYDALIEDAAAQTGVSPEYLRALMGIESAGNPGAVSRKGALGLMQLMPDTARSVGVTDPMDPAQNILGGAKYFKQQLDAFDGDPTLAAAAYNAGPGAVLKYGGVPPYRETRNYVKNFNRRIGQSGMAPEASMDGDGTMFGGMTGNMGQSIDGNMMQMLPEVTPSAVDENVVRSTMGVADKLINGQITGSLTGKGDRDENSTGALAAEMIPTWQTAQKLLNPVNLLQLPFRALRMVDYALRTAAGGSTLSDSAEQALQYVNTGETIMRDPTATARDAAQQELTTAKGLRGQILNPAQKLVHIFTTDPFEGERRALTAAGALRAQWAAQSELDKVAQGRIKRDTEAAKAPWDVRDKRAQTLKNEAEAELAPEMERAQLRNLEGLPEYRRQSLFAQQLAARRNMLTMPDASGLTPAERERMDRIGARQDAMDDRAARWRQEDQDDARRKEEAAMEQRKQDALTKAAEQQKKAKLDAYRAKTAEEAQYILDSAGVTDVEAKAKGWLRGGGFEIVPKDSLAPAEPVTPAAPAASAPAMSGPTNYDAAMGKAREKARQALLRQGNATPSQKQIDDTATELLHQAGIR